MIKNMWREDSGDYQASPWYQSNWAGGAPQQQPNYTNMMPKDNWGQPSDMVGGARPNPWQGKLPGSAPVGGYDVNNYNGTGGKGDQATPPGYAPNDMVRGPRQGGFMPQTDQQPNVLDPRMEELRRRRGVTQGFQQFRNTDNDYRRNQTQYLQKPFQQLTLEEMQQRPMHGGWQAQGGPATSRGSPFKSNYENYRTY